MSSDIAVKNKQLPVFSKPVTFTQNQFYTLISELFYYGSLNVIAGLWHVAANVMYMYV